MTTNTPFQTIEESSFRFELGLESGLQNFIRAMAAHPSFREVAVELQEPEEQRFALNQLSHLANVAVDPRYLNPYDVTLAAYTLAIALTAPKLAGLAAGIASEARNTWWCGMIVDHVGIEHATRADASADDIQASEVGVWSEQANVPMVPWVTTLVWPQRGLRFFAPIERLWDAHTLGATGLTFHRSPSADWIPTVTAPLLAASVDETTNARRDR